VYLLVAWRTTCIRDEVHRCGGRAAQSALSGGPLGEEGMVERCMAEWMWSRHGQRVGPDCGDLQPTAASRPATLPFPLVKLVCPALLGVKGSQVQILSPRRHDGRFSFGGENRPSSCLTCISPADHDHST
jgi:hypothetical protein